MLMSIEPEVTPIETAAVGLASADERRRGLRIAQERPIKVYDPRACRFIGGQTHDISTTGLRISLPMSAAVMPGSILNIHVGVAEGGQPLANRRGMMSAKVVWVDRNSDESGRLLAAGIELTANVSAHMRAA